MDDGIVANECHVGFISHAVMHKPPSPYLPVLIMLKSILSAGRRVQSSGTAVKWLLQEPTEYTTGRVL